MLKIEAKGRIISNFALTHFNAAIKFSDKVSKIESTNAGQPFGNYFEEVTIYCSSCIITAAASLEALINELYLSPGPLRKSVDNFKTFFWGGVEDKRYFWFFHRTMKTNGLERKPALLKYKKALILLEKSPLSKDEDIYRYANLLISFRDYLIHFKPLWDDEYKNEDLESRLHGLFETSPFVDSGADFLTMHCMSAGCANWAVKTARNFIQDFSARIEVFPDKFRAFH